MTEKRTIGGYFGILSELGEGGFGRTFLAEDLRFNDGRKYVVKLLKTQSDDPEFEQLSKRLFAQEVKTLYQLGEHPQIPSIVTHFEEDGDFFFVQEYVAGKTFAEELAAGKIYSQREAIDIVGDLLSVLAFVHRQGVIHRDVKPANLICRQPDGKVVLIDFGAVKQVGGRQRPNPHQRTQGTIAIGSEGYMPAEQLAGHPRFASDVYAAGMFAVQLLTRTHPTDLRQNQRTGEWIWQDRASVNVHLAEFINRMIRFDFRQRFGDAVEALENLKRLNLNLRAFENNWIGDQHRPNVQKGMTQATFFSPGAPEPMPPPAPPPYNQPPPYYQQPPPFIPKFEQTVRPLHPSLRKYDGSIPKPAPPAPPGARTTRVENLPPLGPVKPVGPSNVTVGNLAFDDIRESGLGKSLVVIGVLVLLAVFVAFLTISALRPQTFELQPVPAANPAPKNMPAAPPSRPDRGDQNEGFMGMAAEKERRAVSGSDWAAVADEWQRAREFYLNAENEATDDDARAAARKNAQYCENRKFFALSQKQRSKS